MSSRPHVCNIDKWELSIQKKWDMGHVGRCLEMIERRLQNRTIKNEHNNQRTEIRLRRVVVQDQVTVPSSEMFPARFHLCHIQPNDAE